MPRASVASTWAHAHGQTDPRVNGHEFLTRTSGGEARRPVPAGRWRCRRPFRVSCARATREAALLRTIPGTTWMRQ